MSLKIVLLKITADYPKGLWVNLSQMLMAMLRVIGITWEYYSVTTMFSSPMCYVVPENNETYLEANW